MSRGRVQSEVSLQTRPNEMNRRISQTLTCIGENSTVAVESRSRDRAALVIERCEGEREREKQAKQVKSRGQLPDARSPFMTVLRSAHQMRD